MIFLYFLSDWWTTAAAAVESDRKKSFSCSSQFPARINVVTSGQYQQILSYSISQKKSLTSSYDMMRPRSKTRSTATSLRNTSGRWWLALSIAPESLPGPHHDAGAVCWTCEKGQSLVVSHMLPVAPPSNRSLLFCSPGETHRVSVWPAALQIQFKLKLLDLKRFKTDSEITSFLLDR